MSLKTPFIVFSLLANSIYMPAANAAAVESVSRSFFRQLDTSSYWQATVKCVNQDISIALRKEVSENIWCSDLARSNCNSSKAQLATDLCAALTTPSNSASKPLTKRELINERMAIDQELLQIQEEKLQLRRKELRLRKEMVIGVTN